MAEKEKRTSSTQVGGVWYKVSEGGKEYYPISINPELLPLTITDKHSLVMFPIPEENRTKENSPNFKVVLSLKEQKAD